MPNYRIVAIHGLNRMVVRDEKGNESLRRASHLKVCDWKQKVTNMMPDQDEYDKSGRSTKLLIHPKDIPDLQFDRKSRNSSEILPDIEISMIEVNNTPGGDGPGEIPPNQQVKEKSEGCLERAEERGEFSPKGRNCTRYMNNLDKQYIVGSLEENLGQEISKSNQPVDSNNNETWFHSPMSCVSKWSKALKHGVTSFMGLTMVHTASITDKGE